jgi:putrescine transport system substrate-binding protein
MLASQKFRAVAALAAMAMGLSAVPAAAQKERVLNVYNWSDYVDPQVLQDFTKETGIKLRYDTFDSNDTLEAKLLAGKSGYDIVVPTAYFLERQIKAGLFQKLDKSKLPNLVNVWPQIAERLSTYDPGNNFAVNYMWGTTGIGYNVKKATGILGGALPDSWDIVFKPENLAKFKDCGVMMLDSSDDIMPAALYYLGLNPNSTAQADLDKAAELVARVRPSVRKFHSSEYLTALATGEICLVVGWSGDIKQAQKRAAEAKGSDVAVGYAIPKTGAQMFFDNFAIPKDAKNVAEAHEFINYMLRPEVAAKNTNFIGYPNGNLTSQKLVDPSILQDKTVYPDDDTMKRLYIVTARDAKTQRIINRLWTKVKTGK